MIFSQTKKSVYGCSKLGKRSFFRGFHFIIVIFRRNKKSRRRSFLRLLLVFVGFSGQYGIIAWKTFPQLSFFFRQLDQSRWRAPLRSSKVLVLRAKNLVV